jgi:hypothetical protein
MVLLILKRQFAKLLLKESFDLKQSVHYRFDLKSEPSGLITLISALPFRYLHSYIRFRLTKDTLHLPRLRILGSLDIETKAIILRI